MLWIDAQQLFGLAGQVMLAAWLLLLTSLWVERLQKPVDCLAMRLLPIAFGAIYVGLMVPNLPFAEGGFSSLDQVRLLFGGDQLLLAGWLHFLVFDYFIGGWIGRDCRTAPVARALVVACLLLCFLAGPAGLLVYLLLQQVGLIMRRRRSVQGA